MLKEKETLDFYLIPLLPEFGRVTFICLKICRFSAIVSIQQNERLTITANKHRIMGILFILIHIFIEYFQMQRHG